RGGGPVVARAGLGCGAVALPLRLDLETAGLLDGGVQRALVERIARLDAVAQVWLLRAERASADLPDRQVFAACFPLDRRLAGLS
ncbi:MAG: hypothetical protein IH617_15270, partial [Hydrogenophaga sp.]|nr:hypothetical protein [Hydrogenophaga sp.]